MISCRYTASGAVLRMAMRIWRGAKSCNCTRPASPWKRLTILHTCEHSMKIVVLGANSFSGQDFVDLLLDNPTNQVIGVSRSAERSALFLKYKSRGDLSRYRYYQADLNRDMSTL